jgi:microsomal dipeptidase-like Zn-dependent dipeptidase
MQKRGGFPDYKGWPRWDTIAHQQVWEGFLKDAHQKGLSLIIVSAVNFKPMCMFMPKSNRKYSCNDMDAVDVQITALHKFIDDRNWVELALSPAHARKIIESGKLAILLSIEVTDLFEDMDWKKALDHYYSRGVRTFQIAHQLNNRFAGAAIHDEIFQFFQFLRRLKNYDLKRFDFKKDASGKNKMGLTNEGKELIKKMIAKNMLIDLAHLSEVAIHDTVEILKTTSPNYPLYMSHGHFRDIMVGRFARYEKSSPQWVLEIIKDHNGIFGLRTGAETTKHFGKVPNDCDGSSKSFAQAYEYGKSRGINIALASDLNGFIQQIRPRFGNNRETCGASGDKKRRLAQQKIQTNPLGRSFDQSGLGHIGQLNDLVDELRNFGVDTSELDKSSENFIVMWERAFTK